MPLQRGGSAHNGDAQFDPDHSARNFVPTQVARPVGLLVFDAGHPARHAGNADAAALIGGTGSQGGGTLLVRVNGKEAGRLVLPKSTHASDPILLDVSSFLIAGANRLELIPSAGSQASIVRLTSTYWTPWVEPVGGSRSLLLSVSFDHTNSKQGEAVRCRVEAERVGFRGYGMMMAEVGLPPGAEVDRSSLEELVDDWHLGINHYEVLPDGVTFYLWPAAGGVKFEFAFAARISMRAQSRSAVLYDYYNPAERVEVPPVHFTVPAKF